MPAKSAASAEAKKLFEEGATRHEARRQLQLLYDTTHTKGRISQLLTQYWGKDPEASASSSKREEAIPEQSETSKRKRAEAMSKEKTKGPVDSDTTDSSIVRNRVRLTSMK
jgi:hypothetical protein